MIKVILQNTLQQISDLLTQLSQEEYALKDELLSGSSIGMHTRHIIEFAQCLLSGVEESVVCYDNRKRDLSLENSPLFAIQPIKLKGCYGTDAHHNYDINTTIQREIAYNVEHAIHHMAILKIAVKQLFPSISIPDDFGIAHSTVQYEKIHQA